MRFRSRGCVGVRRLAVVLMLARCCFGWGLAEGVGSVDDDGTEVSPDLKAILFSDTLVDRKYLPGSGKLVGSTAWASRETMEPRHGGKKGGRSIWFGYRAPADGMLVISTEGSRFDTLLAVYEVDANSRDASFGALTPVGFADDGLGGDFTSKLVVPVRSGREYAVVVDGFAGSYGDVVLAWSFMQRASTPPSILWSGPSRSVSVGERVVLSVGLANAAGVELRWLREGTEVSGEGASAADWVLPSFAASDVGRYRLRVRSGDVDLYSDWIELQLNSEGGADAGARDKMFDAVETALRAESTLVVAPAGGDAVRRGRARLQAAPVGVVRGMNGSQVFSTVSATRDPDEPQHCGVAGGASYWFAYEAADRGMLHFDGQGTQFAAILAVYTYDEPLENYAQLQSVTCDVASPGGVAAVDFRTEPGRTYLVVLDGVGGARGLAQLNYRFEPDRAPAIPRSPSSVTVSEGQPLVLSADVTGTAPLSLLWRRDGVAIPGAVSAEYRVGSAGIADAGNYRLEVTNAMGAATSQVAVVEVRVAPRILSLLAGRSVRAGDAVEFVSDVTGTGPLEFRWYRDGTLLAGKTGPSLVLPSVVPQDAGDYRYVVGNAAGSATSSVARLEIAQPPVLVGILADRWIEFGVSTTVTAPVEGSEPLDVRWFRSGSPLPGGTGRALVFGQPMYGDSGSYHFVASNAGGSVTSVVARFEVVRRPELAAPLLDRQVAVGDTLVLTASVAGDGPLTYAWSRDGIRLEGVFGPELRVGPVSLADSGEYRFEVQNPVGLTSSPPARVEVRNPPTAVVTPERVRRARGGAVALSATLGGDGPFELQWYRRGVAIAGATGAVLSMGDLADGDAGEYRLHVRNSVGVFTNGAALVEVVPAPQVEVRVLPSPVPVGGEVEFLAVVEGGEALSHRWYRDGELVSGASGDQFTLGSARMSDAGDYRVEVETDLGAFSSSPVTLRVLEPVRWLTVPAGGEVAVGSEVELRADAAGTPPLMWVWRKDGASIPGQTNATLRLSAVTTEATGIYRVSVGNGVSAIDSGPIPLVVLEAPRIVSAPVAQRVGRGGRARFSVQAEAGNAPRVAWIKDGRVVEGANGMELVLDDCLAADAGLYEAEVENIAGRARSAAARLEVREQTGIWYEPENGRVVVGLLVPRGVGYRLETAPGASGPWTVVVDGVGTESGLAEFPFPVGSSSSQLFRYGIGPAAPGR